MRVPLQLDLKGMAQLPFELCAELTVEFETASATDLAAQSGQVSFPPGAKAGATAVWSLGVVDDRLPETSESFRVKLTLASSSDLKVSVGEAAVCRVVIEDNDPVLVRAVAGHKETKYLPPDASAKLTAPAGLTLASEGLLFVADYATHKVRVIDPRESTVRTLVNHSASNGFKGDGGPPKWALLTAPRDVAIARDGTVYVADAENHRIRRVRDSVVETVAGNGKRRGFEPGQGPQTAIGTPQGIALDQSDRYLYFSDSKGHRILRLDVAEGVVSLVAGTGERGFQGDGGQAVGAKLNRPAGLAVDSTRERLYFADRANHRVRAIDLRTGIVATVAGSGVRGFAGDGAQATRAQLQSPEDIAVDSRGRIYLCDTGNRRVRVVSVETGRIETLAGAGAKGSSGDGGPAARAEFEHLSGIVVTSDGTVYVSDSDAGVVRRIGVE